MTKLKATNPIPLCEEDFVQLPEPAVRNVAKRDRRKNDPDEKKLAKNPGKKVQNGFVKKP